MSVTVRPYQGRDGQWEVDISIRFPDGSRYRERRKVPSTSVSGARKWGESRQRQLLSDGIPQRTETVVIQKEVPTLKEFAPRFLDGYARANQQKPSGIAAKETILRKHLIPYLGAKGLGDISNEDVQKLKSSLAKKAPKTVNNILTVLNTLMRVAVEWEIVPSMPCAIRLVRTSSRSMAFHDFKEFEQLVAAAKDADSRAYRIVLLGGEAGLRCGEMMALEWGDVNLTKSHLVIERSDWKGNITATKGGRVRYVPLTQRLAAALRDDYRRSGRVLCDDEGQPLTQKMVQVWVQKAARRANLTNGGVHVLRHTFCSHLAMKGAPARAIQDLAGHRDLATTQRYMHLSPAALDSAIRLLDAPPVLSSRGEIVEAAGTAG